MKPISSIPQSSGFIILLHWFTLSIQRFICSSSFTHVNNFSITADIFSLIASDFFILKSNKRRKIQVQKLREEGKPIPFKPKFTKTNKFIVFCKRKFGMYVICFWAPFFLSVPLGSIVVAKFYGKLRPTFLYISLGMAINAGITTFLAYVIFS